MTYGWAILIVTIVVAVLWQWGFFNPSGTIREGQGGFWGVVPEDSAYASNGQFTIALKNNIDGNITIKNVTVSTSSTSVTAVPVDPKMYPGQISSPGAIPPVNLDPHNPGSNFEVFVIIAYNDTRVPVSTLLSSGRIWGAVE